MKIIGVEKFGGPEALTVLDVPEPHAGPGEVRIRVKAAAVSPTDTVLRSGGQGKGHLEFPAIPGMDAAGIIDESNDAGGWEIGDKVMSIALPLGAHRGAYAEYLVAPADSLARIPAGRDFAEASTLPMNGLTAVQTLEKLGLQPGQSLAVTGAAGTLGNYLVQLAKQAGLVVVADAAEKDRTLVSDLGPDYVVERGDGVAEQVRELFPDGVDAVADAAVMNEKAVSAVKDGGGFATYRWWQQDPGRGITVHAIAVRDEYHSGQKLEALRRLAEDGTLTLRVADRLPADKAAEAHRRLEAGGVRGRLVLLF
ncbi:NADP-dependent oxidoreductase [Arthrobacter sp. zg-Y1219]|uniref:NADP-dependent oxidoreductase n=1 Tax=Arthrobacter sp. zg-Y1219 TaxID=3049067 RepID=UPI0024C22DA9|nr:NADP-dependent oxidoreductase [Arthrobacter sp. zg-Y1219]MDK1361499.1 NADP-dependent oxidoreductase [Arthrobacter sp. zg-Y1219]